MWLSRGLPVRTYRQTGVLIRIDTPRAPAYNREMFGKALTASFGALCMVVGLVANVDARRALSEDELDQTNAGGLEVRYVSDEPETVAVDAPDLFVNRLFGQNEVITRVVIEIISTMDFAFNQSNQIAQSKSSQDLEAIVEASKSIAMVVRGADSDSDVKAVINNVSGNNQVETAVNISIVLPVGQANIGRYANPFAVSGGGVPTVTPSSGAALPTPGPQFDTPTTLGGAMSLMQDLARQYPQAASGLQEGASIIQSLPK